MSNVIFITGIGTDVGKTVAAAILTEALEADYWKPVQAGFREGTDAELTAMYEGLTGPKILLHYDHGDVALLARSP